MKKKAKRIEKLSILETTLENFSSISFNSRFKKQRVIREFRFPFPFKKWNKIDENGQKKRKKRNIDFRLVFERFIDLSSYRSSSIHSSSTLLTDDRSPWTSLWIIEYNRETREVTFLNSCRCAILAVNRPTQAEIQAGFRLRIESEPKILGVFVCSWLGFAIKTRMIGD